MAGTVELKPIKKVRLVRDLAVAAGAGESGY
jgi:hypothetical protein